MRLICPADPEVSIPLRIAKHDSKTGARLGGRGPVGVFPPSSSLHSRYFATIPLAQEPDIEMSIFLTTSIEEMTWASFELWTGEEPVSVISHPLSRRGEDDATASDLSPRAILVGEPSSDLVTSEEGQRLRVSGHKIGGRPYFISGKLGLESAVLDCFNNGFFHAVQFDFPGPEEEVEEDWPFGDGEFHVLARPPFGRDDFRSFWEF